MRVVVGLGNPGQRYRRTRHNAGFLVVDVLAARCGGVQGSETHGAWVARAQVAGVGAFLVKPLTFMNRSGESVAALLQEWGAEVADLVVVVDDVALELGTLRIRAQGSHGGHNGLRSLIDALGTDEFVRIRIGVRRGELPADLAGYVLADFDEEEVLVVQETLGRAADAVECVMTENAAAAMNRFNGAQGA